MRKFTFRQVSETVCTQGRLFPGPPLMLQAPLGRDNADVDVATAAQIVLDASGDR